VVAWVKVKLSYFQKSYLIENVSLPLAALLTVFGTNLTTTTSRV